jgi:hypothetical protein
VLKAIGRRGCVIYLIYLTWAPYTTELSAARSKVIGLFSNARQYQIKCHFSCTVLCTGTSGVVVTAVFRPCSLITLITILSSVYLFIYLSLLFCSSIPLFIIACVLSCFKPSHLYSYFLRLSNSAFSCHVSVDSMQIYLSQ